MRSDNDAMAAHHAKPLVIVCRRLFFPLHLISIVSAMNPETHDEDTQQTRRTDKKIGEVSPHCRTSFSTPLHSLARIFCKFYRTNSSKKRTSTGNQNRGSKCSSLNHPAAPAPPPRTFHPRHSRAQRLTPCAKLQPSQSPPPTPLAQFRPAEFATKLTSAPFHPRSSRFSILHPRFSFPAPSAQH